MKYFNAITLYRLSNYMYGKRLKYPARIVESITYFLFNCSIPCTAIIGRGTFCSHRGIGVVVHKRAVIGEDCVLGANVTIGGRGKNVDGAPRVGNNVYIATGAKILGPVDIGDNVTIGANAVVLSDVSEGSTAVGIPAKVLLK